MIANRIINYLKNPLLVIVRLLIVFPSLIRSDELFLKLRYYVNFEKWPDFKNPKTFNEKLQWLKLHDRKLIYTKMVDKYEVKKYVASVIGEQYIIPTLAVYDRVEDIDFDALPNQFVLKCTHDSGGIVICKDKSKLDRSAAIKKLRKGLKRNYFYMTREWPYKNVKPRIIAEKYMTNIGQDLDDYKVHNFNGIPRVILLCRDRFKESGLTEDFYGKDWEHLDIMRPKHLHAHSDIERPKELDEILRLSELLAQDKLFVRSDFYIIDHQVYFGEMTFYPASGMKPFIPEEWDSKLGKWLDLSQYMERT